jgi:DNA gyrase subunit B
VEKAMTEDLNASENTTAEIGDNEYDASLIQVLPQLNYPEIIEQIRYRPGLYLGSTAAPGIEHLIYELVSNVLDLYLVNRATFVQITLKGEKIIVADDGPGFAFDEPSDIAGISLATKSLTHIHWTGSEDNHAPHVHMTSWGLGIAPIGYVAAQFNIQSWRKGALWEQRFVRGIAQDIPKIIRQGRDSLRETQRGRGTTIELIPDPEIFGESRARPNVVRKALFETAHLTAGLKIGFQEEQFHAPTGLEMLGLLLLDPVCPWMYNENLPPFHIKLRHENTAIEAAVLGRKKSDPNDSKKSPTRQLSWVNGANTPQHGSHVNGLKQALQEIGWNPELMLIHVVMFDPVFAGPVKSQLDVPHIQEIVKNTLLEPLRQHYLTI